MVTQAANEEPQERRKAHRAAGDDAPSIAGWRGVRHLRERALEKIEVVSSLGVHVALQQMNRPLI